MQFIQAKLKQALMPAMPSKTTIEICRMAVVDGKEKQPNLSLH